jgi:hypothetical protein
MNSYLFAFPLGGVLFLLILFLGFRLHKIEKPYPGILFNLHKLISLGTAIFLAITINKLTRIQTLDWSVDALLCFTFVSIAVMILSGGLLSMNKPVPAAVSSIHKVVPYLSLVSCAVVLYMLMW